MSSSSPDRTLRRTLSPAVRARRPTSKLATIFKLLGVSLILGLMLVSLDITPSSILAQIKDVGPGLEQLGHNLWRATEILLGCLLAGGILVLPLYAVQRWWTKRRQFKSTGGTGGTRGTGGTGVRRALVPVETKTPVTPLDGATQLPIARAP